MRIIQGETGGIQVSDAPALPGRSYEEETADRFRRRTRNGHEWTRIPMDLLCCGDLTGGGPPGSAGVPPAQDFPQPRLSPPPGSTGNGARTQLCPSPCRCGWKGGRVLNRRETERHRTGVHAGGTPALPGGAFRMVRWWDYPAGDFSESRRTPFGKLPFARVPAPHRLHKKSCASCASM